MKYQVKKNLLKAVKYAGSCLTLIFIVVIQVQAQKELINLKPSDRGKQSSWKEPTLLPEKYAKQLKYNAITYGREGLIPLPSTSFGFKVFDWNQDGYDDIVGCNYPFHQGVPYIIVYTSSGGENPVFSSPQESQIILEDERLGRYFELMDVDGDGQVEILTFQPGSKKLLAFKNTGSHQQPKWTDFYLNDDAGVHWAHVQDVLKEPPFTATDWDGDGKKDLLIGANHPSVMKHGYGTDPAVMKPLSYRVYFSKNIGSDNKAVFARPQMVMAGVEPVQYSGFAYPLTYDIDKDGLPDLISGEHRPGIRVYKNVTEELPQVDYIGNLQDQDGTDLTDIIYFHLEMGDINGDGKKEFVSTTQFSGTTYYYPLYATDEPLRWKTENYLMMEGDLDSPIYGPAICTIEPVDWDQDGDMDLLTGAEPGMPVLFKNTGSDHQPEYANPEFIKFYNGDPVRTYSVELGDGSSHGAWEYYDDRSTPTVADWDNDGIPDIVSSTQGRRLYWLKGKNVSGELRFSHPNIFMLNGEPLLHPHRTKPAVVDWDGDGKMDLVALNTVSEIAIYLGNQNSNLSFTQVIRPVTTENDPLVGDLSIVEPPLHSSLAGRTGIAIFDWDNDGHQDIITHKHRGSVLYYRNTGKGEATFEPARIMFDFDSHLGGPAIMDYNGDGYPDILLGGDRKRYVGEKKLFPMPVKAQLMWYDGQSLPFPSKKRTSKK